MDVGQAEFEAQIFIEPILDNFLAANLYLSAQEQLALGLKFALALFVLLGFGFDKEVGEFLVEHQLGQEEVEHVIAI